MVLKIGLVGYGNVGQYLFKEIEKNGKEQNLEVSFVWNRSKEALNGLPEDVVLEDLNNFSDFNVDLIVEVAHPSISKIYGEKFLQKADYFIGSPTALADSETNQMLRKAAKSAQHSMYIPSGALWGATDIQKMADIGTLNALKVTMRKHPSCFRLNGELHTINQELLESGKGRVTLYEGPVRGLCPLAPNNVNTMAAAAIAAHNLGFDKVVGCLVADFDLSDRHIVEVSALGPTLPSGGQFKVETTRINPASAKAVTGQATYASFYNSLIRARNQLPGVHLC